MRSELYARRNNQPSAPHVEEQPLLHEHKKPDTVHNEINFKQPATTPGYQIQSITEVADDALSYPPTDEGIGFSPAVVIRQMDSQLTGYRRMFETVRLDIVHLHIIDEQTADNLVSLFVALSLIIVTLLMR